MPDKYTLEINNFRSIRSASVDIAPLTVVYGPNGSGKSSLIYALLTLKNFLTNPNLNRPSLFTYPSLSLGDLDEVAHCHDAGRAVSVSLNVAAPGRHESKHALEIAESGGRSSISVRAKATRWKNLKLGIDIPFPYSGNQSTPFSVEVENGSADVAELSGRWNGIELSGASADPALHERALGLMKDANKPIELAWSTRFAPLRRGFSLPMYGITSVTPNLETDGEVASSLANDKFLARAVSDYVEKVANTRIQVRPLLGSYAFAIDSIPRNGGVPSSIVNDGFGINQLAYMFAVILSPQARIAAIEEPEIHLHPAMVRKLVHAMIDIVAKGDKRIIVSTHSETFMFALLTRIITGEIGLDDVSFILADNSDGESVFSKKEAKANGQIEDGLSAFAAGESEDLAIFLGLDPNDPLGIKE